MNSGSGHPFPPLPPRTLHLSFVCLILLVTAVAFAPVLKSDFFELDDGVMVVNNPKIMDLSLRSAGEMFVSFHYRLYHPLTLLSYAAEYALFDLNPAIFHATNVLLHLLSAFLVYWLMVLLGERFPVAALVALLFGVHPLHVESVAWISERKDVLYAFFFLFSAVCFVLYRRKQKRIFYYSSLLLFVLSLLSKPMAVTLPLVLLLTDYAYFGRGGNKSGIALVPFLLLAALFSGIAVLGHRLGPKIASGGFTIFQNLLIAQASILFYMEKLLLPVKLSVLYPPVAVPSAPLPHAVTVSPLIFAALGAAVVYSHKVTKKALFGVLFFLATIAPVLHLVPFGLNIPADRYTYVPAIGLFLIVALAFERVYRLPRGKAPALLLSAVLVATLAFLTHQRCAVWKNSASLFDDVFAHYPRVVMANTVKGERELAAKDPDAALAYFDRAIENDPRAVAAYLGRGRVYLEKGERKRAFGEFRTAFGISPANAEVHLALGDYYAQRRDFRLAIGEYTSAIATAPHPAAAYRRRAMLLLRNGEHSRAAADLKQAEAGNRIIIRME